MYKISIQIVENKITFPKLDIFVPTYNFYKIWGS